MASPETRTVAGGRQYHWPEHDLCIELRPRRGRGLEDAELVATWTDSGYLLHETTIELLGESRGRVAKTIAAVAQERGIPWTTIVNHACALEIRARREGVVAVPHTEGARDLLAREIAAVPAVVEGTLTVGSWILGGKPKLGKSWLALNLLVAVASGGRALGQVPVEQGEALYLALEDTPRRLQARLRKVLNGAPPPAGLHFATQWDRLDAGGLEALDGWLGEHPACRLVVIDTLARARPQGDGQATGRLYQEDYSVLADLAQLAGRHGCVVMAVHHLRKSSAADGDPVEQLSGTMGLSGGADGILVLERRRGQREGVLHVVGRDLEADRDLALEWDDELTSWVLVGDAAEQQVSAERRRILDTLREASEPLSPRDLADTTGIGYGAVRRLLWAMHKEALVERADRGQYRLGPEAREGKAGGFAIRGDQGDQAINASMIAPQAPLIAINAEEGDQSECGLRDQGDQGDQAINGADVNLNRPPELIAPPAIDRDQWAENAPPEAIDRLIALIAPHEQAVISGQAIDRPIDRPPPSGRSITAPDLPFAGDPEPPPEDAPLDEDDEPPLLWVAYQPCPQCDQTMTDHGLCLRCETAMCRGCGTATGSLIRVWCGPCGMQAAREETG